VVVARGGWKRTYRGFLESLAFLVHQGLRTQPFGKGP